MLTAAEALKKLAGEELRGAQAEHLEDEAAAKVLSPVLLLLAVAVLFVHRCCTLLLSITDNVKALKQAVK